MILKQVLFEVRGRFPLMYFKAKWIEYCSKIAFLGEGSRELFSVDLAKIV